MSSYNKIKKYYFTVCIVILAAAVLLAAVRSDWNVSLRTMISILAGWFVLCAATIGVIFLIFNKNNKSDSENR